MGTPCACIYATLFFGYHERTLLLQKYQTNLLLFKQQIDDIFIIWVPSSPDDIEWDHFTQDLNICSSLDWETEKPSNKTHFLDLNIWIHSSTQKLQYSTYQKQMNLFLYIPHHSAHPTNTVKSLIYGLLQTYQRQNPNRNDFRRLTNLLFNRLQVRGHQTPQLNEYFNDALLKLQHKKLRKQQRQHLLQHSNPPTTPTIIPSTTPSVTSLSTLSTLTHPPHTLSPSTPPSHTSLPSNITPTPHTNPNIISTISPVPQRPLPSFPSSTDNQLYFHLQYHPKGLTRRNIQQLYNNQCTTTNPLNNNGFDNMLNATTGELLSIKKLTIAYHRPKNLRDILCPTTLTESDMASVNTIASTMNL